MRQSYVDYAMSVIVGRALPDVRDGLKPVHPARVLFAMSEQNNAYNRPYMKSARIVGDVIGKLPSARRYGVVLHDRAHGSKLAVALPAG